MSDYRPVGTGLLVEPHYQTKTHGGLFLGVWDTYPIGGWVYSVGSQCAEDLHRGDYVVWEDHGNNPFDGEYDSFLLKLDFGGDEHEIIRMDSDVEPVIREHLFNHRRSPSEPQPWMKVKDLETNEVIQFRAADVIEVYHGSEAVADTLLSYRHVTPIDPMSTPGVELVLVPEGQIMFSIPKEEL